MPRLPAFSREVQNDFLSA